MAASARRGQDVPNLTHCERTCCRAGSRSEGIRDFQFDAAPVGFGALAGAASRRTARRGGRSLRATQRIATPWGPIWGLSATPSWIKQLNQRFEMIAWRRGSPPKLIDLFDIFRATGNVPPFLPTLWDFE
jgi:hypothetical protein